MAAATKGRRIVVSADQCQGTIENVSVVSTGLVRDRSNATLPVSELLHVLVENFDKRRKNEGRALGHRHVPQGRHRHEPVGVSTKVQSPKQLPLVARSLRCRYGRCQDKETDPIEKREAPDHA